MSVPLKGYTKEGGKTYIFTLTLFHFILSFFYARGNPMKAMNVLNKLAKWRNVFASWQAGTRLNSDAEIQALKWHIELSIMLRAEVNALTAILLAKGICTKEEFTDQLCDEAVNLDQQYEKKFPGISTDLSGVIYSLPEAAETMTKYGFPA